ncbi:hypothetical protein LIA77_05481 [Sarocladium implicatum]|nr:hypothetical protein LIA77_05481 [Sarocladium implicatum]
MVVRVGPIVDACLDAFLDAWSGAGTRLTSAPGGNATQCCYTRALCVVVFIYSVHTVSGSCSVARRREHSFRYNQGGEQLRILIADCCEPMASGSGLRPSRARQGSNYPTYSCISEHHQHRHPRNCDKPLRINSNDCRYNSPAYLSSTLEYTLRHTFSAGIPTSRPKLPLPPTLTSNAEGRCFCRHEEPLNPHQRL